MKKSQTNARTHDTLIMIWIDTHVVLLQLKCKLTKFAVFQLILVQVWPTPDACVHNMRKTLPSCHLQTKQLQLK